MDYIGKKCPVCEKYFHVGDDIVVCPDCGTPHHRECYEKENACFNRAKHAEGYDYAEDCGEKKQDAVICRYCSEKNDANAFFCKKCGRPIPENNPGAPASPFGFGTGGNADSSARQNGNTAPFTVDLFDPLAGVPKDFDLGDGVTAGEAAKYVKQNTPYFIRIFSNIKNLSKSRFNFSAALFTGGYLLYRKMYKIGAIVAAVQIAMLILITYLYNSADFSAIYTQLQSIMASSAAAGTAQAGVELMEYMATLTPAQNFMLFFPLIYELLQFALMIVVGACANRLYFKHVKKQILLIKSGEEDKTKADDALQTKGGVNIPIAVTLLITYAIVNYLPAILSGIF